MQIGSLGSRRNRLRRAGVGLCAAVALVLAGCGGSGNTGALGQGGSTGARLVIPANESPWLGAYKALVEQYQQETGVQVELRTFPYDEMRTQILNDIQSGNKTYDVYQIDEPNLYEFFAHEWLQPLTDVDPGFRQDPAVNNYADFAYWNPTTKTSDPAGELLVQPLNGNVGLLMYRTDLYQQLGLAVPASWEDAIANGQRAQASGAARYGHVMRTQATQSGGAQITYDFLPLLYAYGGTWFRNEGTDWTPAVNSPQAVQAATVMRQLVELGPSETSTIGQAQVIGAMQAGEALEVHVVAAAAPSMLSESDSNIGDRVGFAVLPAGSTGKPGVASGTWALGIPAGLPPERATAALAFIAWVESKPAQTRFTELGGIPTRADALDGANISDQQRAYLEAVNQSLPHVGKHVRYEFSAEMLPITERHLAEIAAGKVSPQDGMAAMQQELTEIVRKYGYPMAAG